MPVSQRSPRRGPLGRCETSADRTARPANGHRRSPEPKRRRPPSRRPRRAIWNMAQPATRPRRTRIWHGLAVGGGFRPSVWLAARVVPWHTFNFVGFGPVNLQPSHPKYQCSCSQAETLSFLRCRIDLSGQAFTFAWICHSCSSSKVRDERSHVCCRAAEETRSSIERNCRKPAAVEGLPQTCARPAL